MIVPTIQIVKLPPNPHTFQSKLALTIAGPSTATSVYDLYPLINGEFQTLGYQSNTGYSFCDQEGFDRIHISASSFESFEGMEIIHKTIILSINDNLKKFDEFSKQCQFSKLELHRQRFSLVDVKEFAPFNLQMIETDTMFIEKPVLSLLTLPNFKQLIIRTLPPTEENFIEMICVCDILNKHLKGEKDVLDCQEELIQFGLKEYAKL